ncbi:hypothetical protein [Paraburkholderia humisilvae]|uniref:Uncharacterized protein n=1 Tax=Paraburkholderia humisilvae TaxID=627669 RepID=A0A6J5EI84_9BURK|nr:hypothetical protein [Paraburkholderia humisilvae]CAB3765131.1 hypothetical protein LMG29542_05054 [Paraburkholderia humisilvae]
MGCINSTANVEQARNVALQPVRHNPSSQTQTTGSATRQQVRNELAELSRPPSRTSLREGDKYRTLGVIKHYYEMDIGAAGEENAVEYFSSRQRDRHEIKIQDGVMLQKTRDGRWIPMDTNGRHAIFVMNGQGTVYAGDQDFVPKHSSFLAGGPVAAAGTLSVKNGQPQRVTDQSGHYMPPREHSSQFERELRDKGVSSNYYTRYDGKTKAQLEQARVEHERVYPEGVRTKQY